MAVTALEIKSCSPFAQGKLLATSVPTNNWMARYTSRSTRTIPTTPASLTCNALHAMRTV